MTTERQKLFLITITSLFQAQQSVNDFFFKNRLSEDIEQIIDKHVQYFSRISKESQQEYVRSVKDLIKVLEEISYLEKGDVVQIASTHEQTLRYLQSLLMEIKLGKQNESQIVSKAVDKVPKQVVVAIPSKEVLKSRRGGKGGLSETQNKILEFVRSEPDCRTKDVITQFNALSQRTIKRSLKELNEGGRIVKRFDGAAVYYSVA